MVKILNGNCVGCHYHGGRCYFKIGNINGTYKKTSIF